MLASLKDRILKSLCYFDIFDHPLHKDELLALAGFDNNHSFDKELEELEAQAIIYCKDNYFGIQENIVKLVDTRLHKEQLAQHYLNKLPAYAKLIKAFPFVKAVAISGSLSKGVMYEDGDIDYFIITSKNRLWICRSLLVLFKKVFLFNSRKYFCVNYFVDENNLEIIDKNIFTAVEVSHLVPVFNEPLITAMKNKNKWVKEYFPNNRSKEFFSPYAGNGIVKKSLESIFNLLFPNQLDLFLMRLTIKRWAKKFKNFNAEKLELTMRSNRGISKHHPSDFQTKVLKAYKERLNHLKIPHEDSVFA